MGHESIDLPEMFAEYETDFTRLTGEVSGFLDSSLENAEFDSVSASRSLESAEQAVRSMEMELKTTPSVRNKLLPKIKGYKDEVKRLRALLLEANRRQLMGASAQGLGISREHRDRLSSATDRLDDGNRVLEQARRQALEAEDIGSEIMTDLQTQRQTILRSKGGMRELDGNLSTSSGLISAITRRGKANRIILASVFGMLVLTFLIIVYRNFSK
mmetsp:Transcript_33733/g.77356  ORF Transcript_33733/g.77356 Transcript_33733/m.77356 type:complete len:215 (+) Transcript_33733:34-678(+)